MAVKRVPAVAKLRDSALVRFVAKHGLELVVAGMVVAYAASVIVTGGAAAGAPAVVGILVANTLATTPVAPFDRHLAEIQGRKLAREVKRPEVSPTRDRPGAGRA